MIPITAFFVMVSVLHHLEKTQGQLMVSCPIAKVTNMVVSCEGVNISTTDPYQVVGVGTTCRYAENGVLRNVECSADGEWIYSLDDVDGDHDNKPLKNFLRAKHMRKKRSICTSLSSWFDFPSCNSQELFSDTNSCRSNPCLNNGICTNIPDSYTCTCSEGYQGSMCEQDMNSCSSNPCYNNGICTNIPDSYTCTCSEEYQGSMCEQDMNACRSNPCLNNGTCTNIPDFYNCTCIEGYQGSKCEQEFLLMAVDKVSSDVMPTAVTVKADLVYGVEDNGVGEYHAPRLVFRCSFDEKESGLHYYVYWYINENFITARGPSSDTSELTLHETDIINAGYGLGITLLCQLRVAESSRGPVVSDGFFAGIKTHTKDIFMTKAILGTIIYEPTVPIGCAYKTTPIACTPQLQMIDVGKESDEYTCSTSDIAVKSRHWCGNTIEASSVDTKYDDWISKNYSMEVKATTVNYEDRLVFNLLLSMDDLAGGHLIWKGYETKYVTIHVVDDKTWQYNMCKAVVDPHMLTFGGLPYEHQESGDYILYRNKKYSIEVQERTASCNANRAYCICAVSVRAGGDIFTINLCGKVKVIDFLSCKENILDVRLLNDKMTYQVHTPIGTTVEIRLRPHPHVYYQKFMNVFVYMSPKDVGNVEGLCGNFDGVDRSNDLVHRKKDGEPKRISEAKPYSHPIEFTRSWKIDASESYLFEGNNDPELYDDDYYFCICEADKLGVPVGHLSKIAICSKSDVQLCKKNLNVYGNSIAKLCNVEKKRSTSTSSHYKELWRRLSLGDQENHSYQKRSDTDDNLVITQESIDECYTALMNSYVAVNMSDHLDMNAPINNCAYDLTATGDDTFKRVHTDIINSIVKQYNHLDESAKTNPEKVAEFDRQSCGGNCYGHGICNLDGTCTCYPGYNGSDCSIDISDGPNIEDIQYAGLCDLNEVEECRCFNLQTYNIFDDFFCKTKIRQRMISQSDSIEETDSIGEFVDVFNGRCCPPYTRNKRSTEIGDGSVDVFVTEFEISISNDGVNFGTGRTVYVFDSSCQEYVDTDGNKTFSLKSGYCFIGGTCVSESSTYDACKKCLPKINAFAWTQDCAASTEGTSKPVTVIVAGVVGAMSCVLIIIALMLFIKIKICKHKRSIGESMSGVNVVSTVTHAWVENKNTKFDLRYLNQNE